MLEFYGNFDISTPAITTPDPYIYIYIKNKIDGANSYLSLADSNSRIILQRRPVVNNNYYMEIYSKDHYNLSQDSSYCIYKINRESLGETFTINCVDSSTQIIYDSTTYDLEQLKISIPDNPERSIIYNKDNYFFGDLQVNKNNNVAYVEVNCKPPKFTIYMKNKLGNSRQSFSELNSSTITLHTSNNDIFNINCKDYLEITYDGFLKYEFNYNNSNIPFYFNSFKYSGNFSYGGKDIIFGEVDVYNNDNFDYYYCLKIISNYSYLEKEKYYSITNDNNNSFYNIAYVHVSGVNIN